MTLSVLQLEIYLSKKVYMIKGKYWDLIIFHTTFVIIEYGGQAFMFELNLNVIYLQIQVIYSWIKLEFMYHQK